jgi:hypothetical protein
MRTVTSIHRASRGTRKPRHSLALLALLAGACIGCGPVEDATDPPARGVLEQELTTGNGLSLNGLSLNGLSLNGLSLNGLSLNGLSTSAFNTWFRSNPALADQVMRYVVRCAVPAGQTRTFQDATSGRSYTWPGTLGLAPAWAGGAAATEAEQQVVSACLAAHANNDAVNVPLSVLGRNGQGAVIPYTPDELNAFPKREACFFGNLFRGQGVFFGTEGHLLGDNQSSPRMCSLASSQGGPRVQCPPLQYAGHCGAACRPDASGPFYAACTVGGVTYRALTTRLRDQDIYTCGDGTCQLSESCGTSIQAGNCLLDCGSCR